LPLLSVPLNGTVPLVPVTGIESTTVPFALVMATLTFDRPVVVTLNVIAAGLPDAGIVRLVIVALIGWLISPHTGQPETRHSR